LTWRLSSGIDPVPDRQALTALFLAYLLAIGPHLGRLPAWLLALALLLFSWRLVLMRVSRPVPGRLVRLLLLIGVVFLLAREYGTVLGRDAGVALLIGLSALKVIELRSFRDCMLLVFLCYFIVMTSFLYDQSLWIGAYLYLCVVVLTTILAYLNHSERHRLGRLLREAATIVALALPLALTFYLLFPRIPGGIFGLPDDVQGGKSGMSDTMWPGSINELTLTDDIAFRAEFANDRPPPPQQRYWRGLVFERYVDDIWRVDERAVAESRSRVVAVDGADPVAYQLLLEASSRRWVFALDLPLMAPPGLVWQPGLVLQSRGALRERRRVDLTSQLDYRVTDVADESLFRNSETPADTGAGVRELATRLYREAGNPRAYIATVLRHFHDEAFSYTLTPPIYDDRPWERFLLESRSGYCEHYASAFTLLMRLMEIPARVVVGYQGGEWNPQGNYLIVRQSDAHAWSEVWLDGQGWVRIDPTAAVAPERIDIGFRALRALSESGEPIGELEGEALRRAIARQGMQRLWHDMRLFWDGINTRWYKWIIGFDRDTQRQLLGWLGLVNARTVTLVTLLLATTVLVVLLQAWWVTRTRQDADRPTRIYRRFCRKLADVGLKRMPAEGPLRFARRAATLRPDLAPIIDRITGMYVSIHYAGKVSKENTQVLAQAVRQFTPRASQGA